MLDKRRVANSFTDRPLSFYAERHVAFREDNDAIAALRLGRND